MAQHHTNPGAYALPEPLPFSGNALAIKIAVYALAIGRGLATGNAAPATLPYNALSFNVSDADFASKWTVNHWPCFAVYAVDVRCPVSGLPVTRPL